MAKFSVGDLVRVKKTNRSYRAVVISVDEKSPKMLYHVLHMHDDYLSDDYAEESEVHSTNEHINLKPIVNALLRQYEWDGN